MFEEYYLFKKFLYLHQHLKRVHDSHFLPGRVLPPPRLEDSPSIIPDAGRFSFYYENMALPMCRREKGGVSHGHFKC
jgi:hypothetical protein